MSALRTNWRAVKDGWAMFAFDAEIQHMKVKGAILEGDYLDALHHLSGYKSSILRFPYRTWSYLWEVKWLTVAYLWACVPAPDFLVWMFSWIG